MDVEKPISSICDFPSAYPSLLLSADFRSLPEDFFVEEVLGFEPSGTGEHWLLHIEKIGQNTHWVAEQLAEFCQLPVSHVGFCGRKDRHAVTRQWFSLYAPKANEIDWDNFELDGVKLLSVTRHSKKLRLGDHQSNRFCIRLRHVTKKGSVISDKDKCLLLLEIKRRLGLGVPNYYGEQRFGRDNSNLLAAQRWFVDRLQPHRKRRGMVMSAARSFLFNSVLAERIRQENWNIPIEGDVLIEETPSGPLWGRGRSPVSGLSKAFEDKALEKFLLWCRGLEHCGLQQDRRALVLIPQQLHVNWLQNDLQFTFILPSGCFATTVLAEIAELHDPK